MTKTTAAMAVLATILAGCGRGEPRQAQGSPSPAEPKRVEVTAVDYAYEGVPQTLEAGETTFVLTNEGDVAHEFAISQLRSGITVEEALSPESEDSTVPDSRRATPPIEPGASGEVTVDLVPGRWGYVCFLSSGTGLETPHALEGMFGELTVE